jgi:hypothetical protein
MTEKGGGEIELDGEVTGGLRGRMFLNRRRGTMLWFNEDKDLGALRTDEGERLEVLGAAFGCGEKPIGRCAGRTIEFESDAGAVTRIAFVPEPSPRRARMRHRG